MKASMLLAWHADGARTGGPNLKRFKHRHGSPRVQEARERRTRTALRHLERRARRRQKREGVSIERQIEREGLIPMLCRLVREAGLTMTLYGAPVSGPEELRELALASAVERLGRPQ